MPMQSAGICAAARSAAPTSTHRCRRVGETPGVESRRMSACQHIGHLWRVSEYRRTAGGRAEPDGNSIVCGSCGDRWRFTDRLQLPEWLRAELRRRGL